mgnify:CR=1 FL=1
MIELWQNLRPAFVELQEMLVCSKHVENPAEPPNRFLNPEIPDKYEQAEGFVRRCAQPLSQSETA